MRVTVIATIGIIGEVEVPDDTPEDRLIETAQRAVDDNYDEFVNEYVQRRYIEVLEAEEVSE